MRDLEKSNEVKWLCEVITNTAESYENDKYPIYFDYDGIIGLLEQAQMLVSESARCPRPADLPPGMPWCERLTWGGEVFDPYAFDGTHEQCLVYKALKIYERMHELMAADRESEGYEP